MRLRVLGLISLISLFWAVGAGQNSRPTGQKPVLIRDDRTSDRGSELPVVDPDPIEAQRHLKVGDFYFKRKNFQAAQERYREAIRYLPRLPDSYLKLIVALEKMEKFEEALAVCREFLEANPDAPQIERFQARIKDLTAKVNASP